MVFSVGGACEVSSGVGAGSWGVASTTVLCFADYGCDGDEDDGY